MTDNKKAVAYIAHQVSFPITFWNKLFAGRRAAYRQLTAVYLLGKQDPLMDQLGKFFSNNAYLN